MLRPSVRQLIVHLLVASVGIAGSFASAEMPHAKFIKSATTEKLIALADEIDYTDPIFGNHLLAVQVLTEILNREGIEHLKAVALYRRAVVRIKFGEEKAAMEDVNAALELNSTNAEYLLMKGSLLIDLGKPREGKTFIEKALNSNQELNVAYWSYLHLKHSTTISKADNKLLRHSRPLLAIVPHPYFKSATTFFNAGKHQLAVDKIVAYLQKEPFNAAHRETAYLILARGSSQCRTGNDSNRPNGKEVLRREILAWNFLNNKSSHTAILKSLLNDFHSMLGGVYPGTVLALSEELLKATSLTDKNRWAIRVWRAQSLMRLSRYSEALSEINSAVSVNPNHIGTRTLKTEILVALAQYDRAIKECDVILSQTPEDIEALALKAQIQAICPVGKFRDGESAVQLATKASKLAGENNGSISFASYKALAFAYAETGDFQAADKALTQLRFAAGTLEAVENIEVLSRSFSEKKPWRMEPKTDISRLARHKKLYHELATTEPNLQLQFIQSHYENICNEILKSTSLTEQERSFCLRRRSLCRYWLGKTDKAINDIDELLELSPDEIGIYVLLNRCLLKKNDFKSALAKYESLKKTFKKTPQGRMVQSAIQAEMDTYRIVHNEFESDENKKQSIQQALKRLDQLIALVPQNASLFAFRASCRFHQGDYVAALADSQKCLGLVPLEEVPDLAGLIYQHALILEKLYQFDESVHYAAMAMHLEGNSDRVCQLLSRVYNEVGKKNLAKVWLKK